jgi:3-dehydroquinate synthetase
LPKINKIDKKKFYDFILKDKKHQSKKLNFVLLKGIGKPVIDINVQKNLILKSLDVII